MTDLERFFRRLVGNLAGTDPARLHRPLPLADIQRDVIPYRANRRALALESSEDYEMVLLRLCAGEGGLVRTEPDEARARFVQELGSPNPDLTVLHAFENVVLTLRSEPLARALAGEGESPYAPPKVESSNPWSLDAEVEAPYQPGALPLRSDIPQRSGLPEIPGLDDLPVLGEAAEPEPAHDEVPPHCLYCGGVLPSHRAVNFCPHCGQSQTVPTCSHCRSELEPGWKHCVNCGAAVGEG